MSSCPEFVQIYHEGPRKDFQLECETHPIEQRVALIDEPGMSGLPGIQVRSSVIGAARFAQHIRSRTLAGKAIEGGSLPSLRQSSSP